MQLKKIVAVEATDDEVLDYLRANVKYPKFQAGDAVILTGDTSVRVDDVFGMSPMMELLGRSGRTSQRYRAKRGEVAVVQVHDSGDETYLCLFVDPQGVIERQWIPASLLSIHQKLPADWMPSALTQEFTAGAKVDAEQRGRAAAPLQMPKPDDDDDDDDVRIVEEKVDPVKAAVDRAFASAEARKSQGGES